MQQTDTIKLPDSVIPLQDDFVRLSGEVKLIDSQYTLILTLSVAGKNEISIDKQRYFDQGEYTIAANRLYLTKLIRKSYVHMYTDGSRHPMYSADWDKKIKVTTSTPIKDTLNIGSFYPLETGEYFIAAQVDYWNKSTKHTAQSKKIPFTILYISKQRNFD